MQRYKCIISYDGTAYAGYQIQLNGRTIQGELERVLTKLHKGQLVKVSGSGRTDAGVHAKGQVIHFDSPLAIPEDKWVMALNSLLPADISVLNVEKAPAGFHARFDAKGKEYRYNIYFSPQRDPFMRNYAFRYPFSLDLKAMEEAFVFLKGTHDFTSFCSAKTEVEDKIRTIEQIDYTLNEDLLVLRFVGNGFLYNMVRILTGTLLEVGTGERKPEDMAVLLEKKDRRFAGKTAPGHGLYLWKVFY